MKALAAILLACLPALAADRPVSFARWTNGLPLVLLTQGAGESVWLDCAFDVGYWSPLAQVPGTNAVRVLAVVLPHSPGFLRVTGALGGMSEGLASKPLESPPVSAAGLSLQPWSLLTEGTMPGAKLFSVIR